MCSGHCQVERHYTSSWIIFHSLKCMNSSILHYPTIFKSSLIWHCIKRKITFNPSTFLSQQCFWYFLTQIIKISTNDMMHIWCHHVEITLSTVTQLYGTTVHSLHEQTIVCSFNLRHACPITIFKSKTDLQDHLYVKTLKDLMLL